MKYALILLCFITFQLSFFQSWAQSNKFILKTYTKKSLKKLEIDLNQDGKADLVETYQDEKLISSEKDRKFLGKFNEWTVYDDFVSSEKPIATIKKDLNGDGKIDRIETVYKDITKNLVIIVTQVDSLFKGSFDKKFTTHSKLIQQEKQQDKTQEEKKDEINCHTNQKIEILKFPEGFDKLKIALQGEFYQTDWGYRIHQSCLDKWDPQVFLSLLKTSMTKGLQCLGNLAKENTKNNFSPNGAMENLKGIDYLRSQNNISIVCNEEDYNWAKTNAHASTFPADTIEKSGVKHPFISINKTFPQVKARPSEDEKMQLASTLFHEQFHNLGILHDESIEYPYACAECCLSKTTGIEKENSCKICAGVYTSSSDKNYLNDLIAWGKTSLRKEIALKAIIKYQKEFPEDRWSLFAYADTSSGIFSPVSLQMSKALKKKFKKLTPDEENHLKNIQQYELIASLNDVSISKGAKIIAESHISLYYEKDPKKVMDYLEKNKVVLMELLKKEREVTNENSKYILEDIKVKLIDLLDDIWLDNSPYNNNAENNRANRFLKEIGA